MLVHNNDDGPDPHAWTDTDNPVEYRSEWENLSPGQQQAAMDAVPGKKPGETWAQYTDRLTPNELRTLMAPSPQTPQKKAILSMLRRPGGKHELVLVSEIVAAKRLGLSVADIKALVLPTAGLTGTTPGGDDFVHHGTGSSGSTELSLIHI